MTNLVAGSRDGAHSPPSNLTNNHNLRDATRFPAAISYPEQRAIVIVKGMAHESDLLRTQWQRSRRPYGRRCRNATSKPRRSSRKNRRLRDQSIGRKVTSGLHAKNHLPTGHTS